MTPDRTAHRGARLLRHDGYFYVTGGGNCPNGERLLPSVDRVPLRADGRLVPLERLPVAMNLPRRCVKLAGVGDILYAVSGFGGTLLDTVERAGFNTGDLGCSPSNPPA